MINILHFDSDKRVRARGNHFTPQRVIKCISMNRRMASRRSPESVDVSGENRIWLTLGTSLVCLRGEFGQQTFAHSFFVAYAGRWHRGVRGCRKRKTFDGAKKNFCYIKKRFSSFPPRRLPPASVSPAWSLFFYRFGTYGITQIACWETKKPPCISARHKSFNRFPRRRGRSPYRPIYQ